MLVFGWKNVFKFLAALAVLHWYNLNYRMNFQNYLTVTDDFILFCKIDLGKIASAARH